MIQNNKYTNFSTKKIRDHKIEVLKKAEIRSTKEIIGLNTLLTIYYLDGTVLKFEFDFEKVARRYIENQYKKTGSFKIIDEESNLFD